MTTMSLVGLKHPVYFTLCDLMLFLSAQVAEHRHGQVCGCVAGPGAGWLPRCAARHLRGDALQGSPHHRDVQGEPQKYKGYVGEPQKYVQGICKVSLRSTRDVQDEP